MIAIYSGQTTVHLVSRNSQYLATSGRSAKYYIVTNLKASKLRSPNTLNRLIRFNTRQGWGLTNILSRATIGQPLWKRFPYHGAVYPETFGKSLRRPIPSHRPIRSWLNTRTLMATTHPNISMCWGCGGGRGGSRVTCTFVIVSGPTGIGEIGALGGCSFLVGALHFGGRIGTWPN